MLEKRFHDLGYVDPNPIHNTINGAAHMHIIGLKGSEKVALIGYDLGPAPKADIPGYVHVGQTYMLVFTDIGGDDEFAIRDVMEALVAKAPYGTPKDVSKVMIDQGFIDKTFYLDEPPDQFRELSFEWEKGGESVDALLVDFTTALNGKDPYGVAAASGTRMIYVSAHNPAQSRAILDQVLKP